MFGYWVENSLFREKIKRQNAMDVLKKELNHSRHKIKKVSKLDEKLVTMSRERPHHCMQPLSPDASFI